jgi:hypothetical protein
MHACTNQLVRFKWEAQQALACFEDCQKHARPSLQVYHPTAFSTSKCICIHAALLGTHAVSCRAQNVVTYLIQLHRRAAREQLTGRVKSHRPPVCAVQVLLDVP